jgi:hypothetical protein
MKDRWRTPREVFLVAPYENKWAVREHFALITKVFMERKDAEHHARQCAMRIRPSELVMLGPDGQEQYRDVFAKPCKAGPERP